MMLSNSFVFSRALQAENLRFSSMFKTDMLACISKCRTLENVPMLACLVSVLLTTIEKPRRRRQWNLLV